MPYTVFPPAVIGCSDALISLCLNYNRRSHWSQPPTAREYVQPKTENRAFYVYV